MFLNKSTALRRICDKKSSSGVIRVKKHVYPRKIHCFRGTSMEVVVSWLLINDKTLPWGSRSGDSSRATDPLFVAAKT